ncbi:ParB/RepB/Spo0J family partition protein [Pyrococcus kukulkanii]|uniref:ParB/RepB/Spo0J family partition protein n=1 Tax=Pyrococcus kukulkanii TaxID=1609559 RepID=UPI00356AD9CD
MRIPLDKLVLNPEIAARIEIDEEYLKVLMKSLAEDGQLHPITVRPLSDGKYEIIDGLHRVEAARRLKWKDIEANVVSVDDLEAKFLSLKANLVRRNLEPVQEGEIVYKIMVKHGLTEKQVAEKLGVSLEWVSKRLALVLKVHEEVKKLVAEGKLSLGHAVVISKIKDMNKQVKFAHLILKNGWSIKQAEEALVEFLNDTIFTIGYEGRSFEEFVQLLKKHDIKVVLDVRHDVEFVKPEFSMEVLKRQLQMQGIRYVHVKELGVPKLVREPYVEGKLSHDCFRQWYLWWVEKNRDVWEKQLRDAKRIGYIALLCVERFPKPKGPQKHYCHRHILADYLIKQGFFEKRFDII